VLRTGTDLLTDKQRTRLAAVFANDEHVQVEATWGSYQRIVAAYRDRDRAAAKTELKTIIDAVGKGVPPALTELITLGRTLNRRAADLLAYFDRPHTSAAPRWASATSPLHPEIATRHRRLQTPTTPSFAMSRLRWVATRPRGCWTGF